MPKRRKTAGDDALENTTPRKTRKTSQKDELASTPSVVAETPSGRKSILRRTPSKANATSDAEPTPKTLRRVLFSTPANAPETAQKEKGEAETPTAVRNDRSARRKSARTLQKQVEEDMSDAEDIEQEVAFAREILDDDDSEDEAEEEDSIAVKPSSTQSTPSKRGRPKGKRRERTPSPPPNLPPHELYFFQNRTGATKTSSNTLPSQLLLNHEDYFTHINTYNDTHEDYIRRLKQYHHRAFDQWMFELEEGFNLCLYGYGSKRELAMQFAEYIFVQTERKVKIIVVNGYTPGLVIRDVLATLASAMLPKNTKTPARPASLLDQILATLTEKPPSNPIRIIINSLDHNNLRKPATQALLARLAAHPSISIVTTCDTPTFPLLWDTTLLRQFRWLYHDATTFQPYTAEMDVVEEVNALLGRSGRRLGGKDGVGYVLKSLPENARNLFRILVAEQLASTDGELDVMPRALLGEDVLDPEDILGAEDEEEAAAEQHTPSRRGRGRPPKKKAPKSTVRAAVVATPAGVEYRTLYHKAVEEFVCSSEVNFRTLLKEFHDHQMIESRKDALGTERLIVPFRREELETILEELV